MQLFYKRLKGTLKGYTLAELIVFLAVVIIIFVLAVMFIQSVRARGRDAKRFSDIRAVQGAIESYIQSNSDNPRKLPPGISTTTGENIANYKWSSSNVSDATLQKDLTSFLQNKNFPQDPIVSKGYNYIYCRKGHDYVLAAVMEKSGKIDSDIDGQFRTSGPAPIYTMSDVCILSNPALPPTNFNCSDNPINGRINSIFGSVFCTGYGINSYTNIGLIQFMDLTDN
jgi:type II secretory pathway pseudopilin PulG